MALRTYFPFAALCLLLSACGAKEQGADASEAYATGPLPTAESVQQASQTDLTGSENPGSATVARTMLGRELPPRDALGDAREARQFSPGEPIHVAVELAEATPQTAVRIVWYGPDERVLVEDTKETSSDAKYLHFSVEENQDWSPGEYRAEVWVADQKVDEQRFAVVANRSGSAGG